MYWIHKQEQEVLCVGCWWRNGDWLTVVYPVPLCTAIPESIWVGSATAANEFVNLLETELDLDGFQAEPVPYVLKTYWQQGQVETNFMLRLNSTTDTLLLPNTAGALFTFTQLFADLGLWRQVLEQPVEYLQSYPWRFHSDFLGEINHSDQIYFSLTSQNFYQSSITSIEQCQFMRVSVGKSKPSSDWQLLCTFSHLFAEIKMLFSYVYCNGDTEKGLDRVYRLQPNSRFFLFTDLVVAFINRQRQKYNIVNMKRDYGHL